MSIETYGFSIYIAAFAVSAVWLCWSFLPDSYLISSGIIYYPSKYWAATIPSLVIVAYISWFVYYTLSILILTQNREVSAGYFDSFSKPVRTCTSSIPPLGDIPIEVVNKANN